MQNILVLIFPQFIDGINALLGVTHPVVKFWVSIVTSVVAGVALNYPQLLLALNHPTLTDVSNYLTLIGLIVASTQGIYLKYWENHDVRAKLFPTVTNDAVSTQPEVPTVEPAIVENQIAQ